MLEEEQLPARLEHAMDFGEHASLVGHGAEDKRRDDGVERGVLEWKFLGRGPYDVSLHGRARELPLESPCHRLLGLDEDDLLDTTVEVGKVRAGAAADLEHPSAGLCE